jgi:hypothetical protein
MFRPVDRSYSSAVAAAQRIGAAAAEAGSWAQEPSRWAVVAEAARTEAGLVAVHSSEAAEAVGVRSSEAAEAEGVRSSEAVPAVAARNPGGSADRSPEAAVGVAPHRNTLAVVGVAARAACWDRVPHGEACHLVPV